MKPYYADESVTLYHGRFEDVEAELDLPYADLIVADPPYGETALDWDRWPDAWPLRVERLASSMWCFGSMRMFLDRRDEFAGWKLSQDVVWEKSRAGLVTNRFARVHEHALFWYRGEWGALGLEQPRERTYGPRVVLTRPAKYEGVYGATGSQGTQWVDDKHRAVRSILKIGSVRQGRDSGINPTEKPTGLLEILIGYGCPPGGLVLDPFAGSCSTLVAARNLGRRAIGIEMREEQCESSAKRLAQAPLNFGESA